MKPHEPPAHVPISWGSPQFRTRDTHSLQVTQAWFPADSTLPSHTHHRAVVAVTLKGAIESRFAGRSVLGRSGDVWTEPLGDPHANRVGPEGALVLVIQPDPARDDLLEPCAGLLDGVNHFHNRGIAHLASRMISEIRRDSGKASIMIEALGLEILAWGADWPIEGERRSSWFRRVLELIHDRFREPLTIHELATEGGVHPGHLARVFRSRTGVTPGRYIRRLRIEWAAARLADSDDAIARVALQAGFADQSHFTREFKRQLGATPGQYRSRRAR